MCFCCYAEPSSFAAGEPCTVCHDAFEAETKVVELACSHCFHEDCIMPWLETHNTCPVCRSKLASSAPRPDENQEGAGADGTADRRGGFGNFLRGIAQGFNGRR